MEEKMKKFVVWLLLAAMVLSLAGCSKSSSDKKESAGVDQLVSEYGFQWTDPTKPILNEKGAQELGFTV